MCIICRTLFDYFGEPSGGWPHVSSDFGQIDIAGFPKPHAYWYRANWLMHKVGDAGRPPLPIAVLAHLLDLTDRVTTTLSGITTANFADLLVDGKSLRLKSVGVSEDSVKSLGGNLPKKESDNCTGTISFPVNVSGVQCHGLTNASASNVEECAQECCKNRSCNT